MWAKLIADCAWCRDKVEREARQRFQHARHSTGCAATRRVNDKIRSPPVPSALSLVQGQSDCSAGHGNFQHHGKIVQQCLGTSPAAPTGQHFRLTAATAVQRPDRKPASVMQLPDSQQSTLTAVHPDADRAASHGTASTSGRLQDTASHRVAAPASSHRKLSAARSLPKAAATAASSGQQPRPHHGEPPRQKHTPERDAQLRGRAEELQRAGFPPWAVALCAQPCAAPRDVHERARAFAQLLPHLRPPPPSHAA